MADKSLRLTTEELRLIALYVGAAIEDEADDAQADVAESILAKVRKALGR